MVRGGQPPGPRLGNDQEVRGVEGCGWAVPWRGARAELLGVRLKFPSQHAQGWTFWEINELSWIFESTVIIIAHQIFKDSQDFHDFPNLLAPA